jgi:hypothetical protein
MRLNCLDGAPEAPAVGSRPKAHLPEVVLYCQLFPSPPEGLLHLRKAKRQLWASEFFLEITDVCLL